MNRAAVLRRALCAALLASGVVTTAAQDDAPRGENCLNLRPLDELRAVDDKTILFFMRGQDRKIYRNDVQGICRGLERNRSLSYQATMRLCKGDLITVRETGFTCPLGEFRLISAEEAEILQRAR
jgi:hypothetical protein